MTVVKSQYSPTYGRENLEVENKIKKTKQQLNTRGKKWGNRLVCCRYIAAAKNINIAT